MVLNLSKNVSKTVVFSAGMNTMVALPSIDKFGLIANDIIHASMFRFETVCDTKQCIDGLPQV